MKKIKIILGPIYKKENSVILHAVHEYTYDSDKNICDYGGFANLIQETTPDYKNILLDFKLHNIYKNINFVETLSTKYGKVINYISNDTNCYNDLEKCLINLNIKEKNIAMPGIGTGIWGREITELLSTLKTLNKNNKLLYNITIYILKDDKKVLTDLKNMDIDLIKDKVYCIKNVFK